ncbi:ribonuclease HI, partial [Dysosmobacter welbionis]
GAHGDQQRVDEGQRRHHGVHKGDHLTGSQQSSLRHLVDGGQLIVCNSHDGSPPVLGKLHCVHSDLGVPREADGDHHIPGADPQQLLEDLPCGVGLHQRHVLGQQVQVEVQIPRHKGGGPHPQDVQVPGAQDQVHHLVELSPVRLFR